MVTTVIITHSVDTRLCGILEDVFQRLKKLKKFAFLSVGHIVVILNHIHEYIYVSQ